MLDCKRQSYSYFQLPIKANRTACCVKMIQSGQVINLLLYMVSSCALDSYL